MSVYKLSGTGAGGTENALAQLDVQFDGILTAISGRIDGTLSTNGDFCTAEASFLSVNTIGVNDTRGSLFNVSVRIITLSSVGAEQTSSSNAVGGLSVQLNAGERIFLHITATASRVSQAEIYLYVEDGQAAPVAQRRR